MTMIAQGIWYARNTLCFENKPIKPHLIVAKAISSLKTYRKANEDARALANVQSQPKSVQV